MTSANANPAQALLRKGVLVIGGGVAGIQCALDLAHGGAQVFLVERTPSVGGRMAQLDKTLPTNDCSICIQSPLLVEALRHENVVMLTYSEVIGLEGKAGDFRARVLKHSRYVDEHECIGCGVCQKACPVSVPNEFDMGLGERHAIYIPMAQSTPMIYTIDDKACLNFADGEFKDVCSKCAAKCPRKAIDFAIQDEVLELNVGAVIVATGFDEMDPSPLRNLGYGEHEDILTGLEFERMLNAAGPTGGRVLRRSDGRPPKTMAFVQCVGSRDERYCGWCSRVCCVYSIKQCMIAKDHEKSIEDFYYFYRDVRAYGRGFEEYYRRGQDETGIKFLRSSPSRITGKPDGTLSLWYEDPETSRPASVDTDMVVLTCAMVPSAGTRQLAGILGADLGGDGYFKLRDPLADPVSTTRDGLFVCGCAAGPRDIPDSVAQASAASARALPYVGEARFYPDIRPLPDADIGEEPRIGVFVCHCGHNIGGVVDSKSVAEYARTLPNVAFATDNLYTCSDDTQSRIAELIVKRNLNRVVVAACTPRTHEPIFRQTCQSAGLNPYLFDMANIRDQCSWVHSEQPEEATRKSRDLVRMAVARARNLAPLQRKVVDAEQSVLVIGGGIAGIQCAIDLAKMGLAVHLAEREPRLGGRLRELDRLFPTGARASEVLEAGISELESLPVDVILNASIESIEGFVGNFEIKVNQRELRIGAIVLATGGRNLVPRGKLGYGERAGIITSAQFEERLAEPGAFEAPYSIAFIQCVGSREKEGYTGCSRYCCQVALKQAHEAMKRGAEITFIHRDVRSFTREGEDLYRQVRLAGGRFLRRSQDSVIEVKNNGSKGACGGALTVFDEGVGADVEVAFDLAVLAVPMLAAEGTPELAEQLRIPLGKDGFFLERHVKLGPLETNTEGIFLCGCASYPKDIPDSLAQASGVAAKVGALLNKGYVALEPATAAVTRSICRACGTCVAICEYNAPGLIEEEGESYAQINEALCKGCGTCAAHCPTGAITAKHYTDTQIDDMIEASLLEWEA
jgi:heterodisulfide reductase subunit A